MFEYPMIDFHFLNTNIEINDILENDQLFIYSDVNKYELTFYSDIINCIKNDGYYFLNYKITFLDNKLNIECIFPNTSYLDFCYLLRKELNNELKFEISQQKCYSYKLMLDCFELKANDLLKYSFDFINYDLLLTNDIISQIKSENGYITQFNHLITYHETENLAAKYILIKPVPKYSSINTHHNLIYCDSETKINHTQYDIIEYDFDYLFLNNVLMSDGSLIIHYNNKKIEYILSEILPILSKYKSHIIQTKDYKLYFIISDINLQSFDIKLFNLSNNSFDTSLCLLKSDSFFIFYKNSKITNRIENMSSDPNLDTPDQLKLYSKAELDHMKNRCICNLSGVISDLTDIRFGHSVDSEEVKQEQADYIFNYKVYPSSYSKSLKEKIYNTFGPFTNFTLSEL